MKTKTYFFYLNLTSHKAEAEKQRKRQKPNEGNLSSSDQNGSQSTSIVSTPKNRSTASPSPADLSHKKRPQTPPSSNSISAPQTSDASNKSLKEELVKARNRIENSVRRDANNNELLDLVEDETDDPSFFLALNLLPPEERAGVYKNKQFTTMDAQIAFKKKYPSFTKVNSFRSEDETIFWAAFSDKNEMLAAKLDQDAWKSFATLHEDMNNSGSGPVPSDWYYRAVLAIGSHHTDMGLAEFLTNARAADRIRETLGVRPKGLNIRIEKRTIVVYFYSLRDWIKVFEGLDLQIDDLTFISFLHHLASTNDPEVGKIYMSGLPVAWKDKKLKSALTKEPVSFPSDALIRVAVVTDQYTNKSKCFGFAFIRGSKNINRFLHYDQHLSFLGSIIKVQVAKNLVKKKNGDKAT